MSVAVEKLSAEMFNAEARRALAPCSVSQHALDFFDIRQAGKRWAIGKNAESLRLHALGLINGIVDDSAEPGACWEGIPLVAMCDLPAQSLVANCSSSIAPVSVQKRLGDEGLHAIPWCELVAASHQSGAWDLEPAAFVVEQRQNWQQHAAAWTDLFESMADEASRQTLSDVLCYRLSGNPDYMSAYSVRLEQQYFEPFLNLQAEVFVDAGGYDGDTTELFCERVPDYQKVFLFEPSPKNMAAARIRLRERNHIAYFEMGVSDSAGELAFNPDAGSASAVGAEATDSIRVIRLDEAIQEPVSYIKMDLEGWELPALQGASGLIEQYQPKLAIAVYHAADDFLRLWQWVKAQMPDCRVYLRHYTEGWSETVMYFVPDSGSKLAA